MLDELSGSKSTATTKKVIRYFVFDDRHNSLHGGCLEERLHAAFSPENAANVGSSCKNRLYPGKEQIFINHFQDHAPTTDTESYFFGELVSFGDKTRPSAVDQDLDHPVVPIVKVNPPQGKQWVIAPLYFLIKNNHVFIITSQSLKVDSLENYLHWLLSIHAKVMTDPVKFRLRCEFDRDVVGEDFSDLTSIKIKDPSSINNTHEMSLFSTSASRKEVKSSAKTFGLKATNLFRQLFGHAPMPDEVYDRLLSNKNIHVDIGFKFDRPASSGDITDLRDFIDVFRDMPDEMIEIHTKNSHVKNGKVRLQVTEDIRTLSDNRTPDPDDAARAMFFYYISLARSGKIAP
jgi:hypothetical protein